MRDVVDRRSRVLIGVAAVVVLVAATVAALVLTLDSEPQTAAGEGVDPDLSGEVVPPVDAEDIVDGDDGFVCPPTASGRRLSGGSLAAQIGAGADDEVTSEFGDEITGATACWYVDATLTAPLGTSSRVTNAVTYYVDGVLRVAKSTDDEPPAVPDE